MSLFESKAVKAVRRALAEAGAAAQVVMLPRSADRAEAAGALEAPLGAMVQVRLFLIGEQPVMAVLAGDKRCAAEALPRALNLPGEARPADAEQVRRATGFAADGFAPVGMAERLPTVIDVSLKRFATLYAPAGDPRHVFATTVDELKRLTGGIVSYAVTEGDRHHPGKTSAMGV